MTDIIFTVYSIDKLICLFIPVLVCLFQKFIPAAFHEMRYFVSRH